MLDAMTGDAALAERCRLIEAALDAAMEFAVHDRAAALLRKWLPDFDPAALAEGRGIEALAMAAALSGDLLLSQPSFTGSTAFDRLARKRSGAKREEQAAIAALCQARYRLLQVEGDSAGDAVPMRDMLTDERLVVVCGDLPALKGGTALFARAVMLQGGRCCLAGVVMPLDAAALRVAKEHPAARRGGARWAEAVYIQIVRHGTLMVVGLNDSEEEEQDDVDTGPPAALLMLGVEWDQAGGVADADLLRKTREMAAPQTIVLALRSAVMVRQAGSEPLGVAFERLLLVMMETVQLRGQASGQHAGLDAVGEMLRQGIGSGVVPEDAAPLFASLRQRLGGRAGARKDDPALDRLVQRIQGLRAKTVEQGCTEQEALAAAEKVGELLDRYGLSLGELDYRAQPCEGAAVETGRRRMAPIDRCVPGIAGYFDCRVWMEQSKGASLRYVFFGLRGDVAAAHYLYALVERAFETETALFKAGPLYAAVAGGRRTASNSFQIGLADGIAQKLWTMRERRSAQQRSASGRDLVPVKSALVDEEMARLGLDLAARSVTSRRMVLSEAFAEGQAAGARFEPTRGIAGG